jgi:hypothetical protein
MKLNLVVAILVIAAVPGSVQAQNAGTDKPKTTEEWAPKTTEEWAQRAFETIRNDKTQIKAWCDLSKANDQLNEANQKGDPQAILKSGRQLNELINKIDPNAAGVVAAKLANKEWAAQWSINQGGITLNAALQETVDRLDEVCKSMQQEPDGSAGSEGRSDNTDENPKAR